MTTFALFQGCFPDELNDSYPRIINLLSPAVDRMGGVGGISHATNRGAVHRGQTILRSSRASTLPSTFLECILENYLRTDQSL